ncbi:hypothetical protein BH09VER1_BH09VER1_36540 [soil metagenome]
MRLILIAALLGCLSARAEEAGAYLAEPNPVAKITASLVASKRDELTPHLYEEVGGKFSYHLVSVRYLGTIARGREKIAVATCLFMRSAAKGSEQPTPRGHGFLLCLSPDFHLVSYCRLDFPEVELVGTVLRRGKDTVVDFSDLTKTERRRGLLVDGSDFLPYPFSDRHSSGN